MSNLFPSMNFHVRLGHEILHPSVRSWIGCETRYLPLLTARHGALTQIYENFQHGHNWFASEQCWVWIVEAYILTTLLLALANGQHSCVSEVICLLPIH